MLSDTGSAIFRLPIADLPAIVAGGEAEAAGSITAEGNDEPRGQTSAETDGIEPVVDDSKPAGPEAGADNEENAAPDSLTSEEPSEITPNDENLETVALAGAEEVEANGMAAPCLSYGSILAAGFLLSLVLRV